MIEDIMIDTGNNNHKVVSIASGKGGVGKTFITTNLAASFVNAGKKVLVVDCDMGLANMDILLGINPEHSLVDVIFGDYSVKDIIVPSGAGFDLVPASSGVKEMAQLYNEKIRQVQSSLESVFPEYDIVILDTGAGISDEVLQLNMIAPRNIIVLNKEPTSMTDAYAVIKVMHQKSGRQRFGIVINSAANGKEAEMVFKHLDSICARFLDFHLTYLGHVLYDSAVPRSILEQKVLVRSSPDSGIVGNCSKIADAVSRW